MRMTRNCIGRWPHFYICEVCMAVVGATLVVARMMQTRLQHEGKQDWYK